MIYIPAEDSFLLIEQVKKYASKKKVLDMGAGSGIQSLTAMKAGAKSVLAADIDAESIHSLKQQGIPAIRSNLFSKITKTFDLIIFNPPYLPRDTREDKESQKATTGGKKGDEIIIRFFKQAPNFLNKDGIILVLLSSLTPKDKILNLLSRENLSHAVIATKKIFMEQLEVWKIERNHNL